MKNLEKEFKNAWNNAVALMDVNIHALIYFDNVPRKNI